MGLLSKRKKKQAEVEDAGSTVPSSGGTKALLWVLVILNLAAGGFYGYLALVRSKNIKQEVARNRAALPRLYHLSSRLADETVRIRKEQVAPVKSPQETVVNVANAFQIGDKIRVERPNRSPWKGGNYFETIVPVHFKDKEGYQFSDLIRFLVQIEKANPRIQIKKINFGKRDDGRTTKTWRPREMLVRLFTPRE